MKKVYQNPESEVICMEMTEGLLKNSFIDIPEEGGSGPFDAPKKNVSDDIWG